MCEISVVVPVYNVEAYLREALDSVIGQTFRDFEMILVDDGSTDRSGAIADEYAAQYAFIHTIHQKNAGVSAARNAGIAVSKGTYIYFLDADDWLERHALQALYDEMRTGMDVVCCNFARYVSGTESITTEFGGDSLADSGKAYYAGGIANVFQLLYMSFGFPVWNKIFRADIIKTNRLLFDETLRRGSDVLFNACYWLHIKRVCVLKKALYHYRFREDAITKQDDKRNHFVYVLERHQKFIDYIESRFSEGNGKRTYRKHYPAIFFLSLRNAVEDQFWFCRDTAYGIQCTASVRKLLARRMIPACLRICALLFLKLLGRYQKGGELMALRYGIRMFVSGKTAFDEEKGRFVKSAQLKRDSHSQ